MGNMYEEMIALGIPKEKMSNILHDFKSSMIKDQDSLEFFEGVDVMLEELSKENEIVIITSNVSEVVHNFLNSKNICGYQRIIGGEKETSKVKKIEAIKIEFPEHFYFYIGDTKGDIIEGKKAKVKTIAVTWGWHNESTLKEQDPDYVVQSPMELGRLFNEL